MKCFKNCKTIEECKIGWICNNERVCIQEVCKCRAGESCVRGRCLPGWITTHFEID